MFQMWLGRQAGCWDAAQQITCSPAPHLLPLMCVCAVVCCHGGLHKVHAVPLWPVDGAAAGAGEAGGWVHLPGCAVLCRAALCRAALHWAVCCAVPCCAATYVEPLAADMVWKPSSSWLTCCRIALPPIPPAGPLLVHQPGAAHRCGCRHTSVVISHQAMTHLHSLPSW